MSGTTTTTVLAANGHHNILTYGRRLPGSFDKWTQSCGRTGGNVQQLGRRTTGTDVVRAGGVQPQKSPHYAAPPHFPYIHLLAPLKRQRVGSALVEGLLQYLGHLLADGAQLKLLLQLQRRHKAVTSGLREG